jgi:hypothetical protein
VGDQATGRPLLIFKDLPMKVVLQDVRSLKYVAGIGGWTADVGQARDFQEVPQALDYALGHRLANTRVVLKSANPSYDVVLPSMKSPRASQ